MKKIALFVFVVFATGILSAQNMCSKIYKIFKHPIENSRWESEDIILYKDGTFCVFSTIGNLQVSYSGGWWMADTLLVLHPSQNCDGPLLLDKTEIRGTNTDGLSIEIYNEKGFLKYCGNTFNDSLVTVTSDGCFVHNVKDGILFRYFDIEIKGRTLSKIRTRKRNHKIVVVVLEPIRIDNIYLGRRVLPFCQLEEVDANQYYR